MYSDAKKRGMKAGLWGAFGFFFGLIALIIYLVVRSDKESSEVNISETESTKPSPPPEPTPPKGSQDLSTTETECPNCNSTVKTAGEFCPICGESLTEEDQQQIDKPAPPSPPPKPIPKSDAPNSSTPSRPTSGDNGSPTNHVKNNPPQNTSPPPSNDTPDSPSGRSSAPSTSSSNLISILGSGGAGKTVFFAMLSRVLGRGQYGNLTMEYGKGLGYLRDIRQALESGRWPDKTYTGEGQLFTATIYEERTFRTKKYDISMIDIAGEDFDEVFNPDNPEIDPPPQFTDIPTASGYMFLIDPSRAYEDMWKFYRLIQYLEKVKGLKATGQIKQPVAIVFTKHDKYRDQVREPTQFLEEKMPDLYNLLSRRVKDKYIWVGCISAVGSTTQRGKPRQPLSPRGIGPLMEWMIEKV